MRLTSLHATAQQAPTTSSQCVVSEDGPLGNLFKEYAQALGRYYLNDADPSVDKASNVRSLHDTAAGLLRWIWTHGHRDHWLAGEADAVVQSSREHAERLARGNDDEGSRKNQGSSESCNSHFSLRELSLDDHFGPGKGRHAGGDYYPERRHSVPNEDSHRDDHDCWATRRCPDRVGGDFYRPKYD